MLRLLPAVLLSALALLLAATLGACTRPAASLPPLPLTATPPTALAPAGPWLGDVHWLGHASFKLTGAKTVYIDPWRLKGTATADLILITHAHSDHCSPADVEKIRGPQTVIVAPADCASKFSGTVQVVKPGEKLTVQGIQIETVPAYNIARTNHPKSSGWIGYVVTVNGVRIYHGGDTERIPEMEGLQADVVLLPVDGVYTMTAVEAAGAASAINPKIAVPMHWGTSAGKREDAEAFLRDCRVPAQIMELES